MLIPARIAMPLPLSLCSVRPPSREFRRSASCLLLCCLCLAFGAGRALAQPFGKTIVVPFGAPELGSSSAAADALEAELSRRRVPVVSMHDARDRFTARSRPPMTASDSDLDVLARQAREAIQHVAFGRTAAAQRSVREVILRAERTLESLNRETTRARQILDACLSLVRGSLHDNKRDEAVEQAMRCRRLVPDLAPSEAAHPANVVGVLAEADDLLRRMRTGKLTVQSQPDSSCSVYLNGRHLGTTPFVLDRAASGEYRVQVECASGPGRVHAVQLGDEPVNLLVDAAFDQAVLSEPRLLLRYAGEAELRAASTGQAVQLGQEVHSEDVMLVRVVGSRAELTRVRVQQGRVVGRASAAWDAKSGFEPASLAAAIAALSEGRIEPELSAAAVASASVAPVVPSSAGAASSAAGPLAEAAPVAPASPAQGQRPWRRRTAYALTGLAGGTFAVGLGLELWGQSLQDDLVLAGTDETGLLGTNQRYDSVSRASWLGVASGPLGLGAVHLWVGERSAVPWWGYALSGAGAALAGVGVYELVVAGDCDLEGEGGCLRTKDTEARGAMLISAALPLLSLPLVQWWRSSGRGRTVDATVAPLDGGGYLSLRGRY